MCEISPVHIENLKPVDVKQTNHGLPGGILNIKPIQRDLCYLFILLL